MTVSVLIPTRERLEYLRLAVDSVRRQSSPDWEIVIADNASSQDIRGYAASLDDDRVVYLRSDETLPVTANWNRALDASTGDSVIMLGDDDALMPGHLEAVEEGTDLLYTGAYLFAYPGVLPEDREGYVQEYGYAEFLRGGAGRRRVPQAQAVELVRDAMRFRLRFGFNMQFATLSRALIDRLRAYGPVFQSPFPDYYAMCAALLESRSTVADPRPLVAIGITPKSYGFYYANRREDEGVAFLDPGMRAAVPDRLRDEVLPGTNINTGWLLAMDVLQERLGRRHALPGVDVRRYRYLQAMEVHRRRYVRGEATRDEMRTLRSRLRLPERVRFGGVAAGMLALGAIPVGARRRVTSLAGRWIGQFPEWEPPRLSGRFGNVMELFDALREDPHLERLRVAPR